MAYEHRSHRVTGGAGVTLHVEETGNPAGQPVSHDDLLEQLTTPVLLTHGLDDEIVLPTMAEHHARLTPHAKTSYYQGIGHTPFREDPDRFNAELGAFASSL